MKKTKKISLIILSVMFSASMLLFAASCGKNDTSAFFKGAADTITFGDFIDVSDYLEDIDSEYTLIIKKGDFFVDITDRTLYTPEEPGEWTLVCIVKRGAYKGTSEFKLTVKPETLVWSFTAQNKIYDKGDTLNFAEYFKSLNIQCEYYYDYTVKMDYVAVDGKKEDLTDKTEYTFTQTGEHVFKFHIETEDGVKNNRSQIIKVREITEFAQDWFNENNVEFFNAIIADQDSVDGKSVKVVLDKGSSTGASWTEPNTTTIPYVAFDGNYGLNDYAVVEFTGRNMPQFAFFCDEITNSAVDNKKGIYVSNGNMSKDGRTNELDNSRLTFYAPYKVYNSHFYGNDNGEESRVCFEGSTASPHAISTLALDVNTRYKVIFGFKDGVTGDKDSSKVTAVIRLINLDTEETVYDSEIAIKTASTDPKNPKKEGLDVFADGYFNGKIILYGNLGKQTTFDKVYTVKHFENVAELNEFDKSAQFKTTAPNSVIIGTETEVSKFIDTDKEYTLTATHEKGDVVSISDATFALNKAGKWTFAYKIKDYLEGNETVSIRKGFKTVNVYDGNEETIAWMKQNNVTANGLNDLTNAIKEDKTFVMSFADLWMSGKCSVSGGHPYIALNGNYGAGTFVSLDFVGKAMPYVSFFNKKVTDSLFDGEEGILLINGIGGMGADNETGKPVHKESAENYYTVLGPKKAESGNVWSGERTILGGYNAEKVCESTPFGAKNLVDGTNYRLVVGITNCATGTGANAKFTVNAMLINVDTNEVVKKIIYNCNLSGKITQTVSDDYFNGSIVIYGSTFGETTVKIDSIDVNGSLENYVPQNLEVTDSAKEWISKNSVRYYKAESIAEDKTITLAQNQFLNSNRVAPDAPYIGLNKDINFIGAAVSIDFTGKNMPFIGLAQSKLTSSWTDGTQGILLTNGFMDYIEVEGVTNNTPWSRYANRLLWFKNNLPTTGQYWDIGKDIANSADGTKYGITSFDDETSYRLVAFIEKNTQYNGYFIYLRMYTLKDGAPHKQILSGNSKLGALTDYNDAYFTGKLNFMSAPGYKAQFKINGVYQNATTSDLYKIACKTPNDTVTNILEG